MTDPRWANLRRARDPLVAKFRDAGVERVEYIAALPEQAAIDVYLGTATEDQSDRLRAEVSVDDRVRTVLMAAGLTGQDLTQLKVVVLSQEAVDRDYRGSWFYALR